MSSGPNIHMHRPNKCCHCSNTPTAPTLNSMLPTDAQLWQHVTLHPQHAPRMRCPGESAHAPNPALNHGHPAELPTAPSPHCCCHTAPAVAPTAMVVARISGLSSSTYSGQCGPHELAAAAGAAEAPPAGAAGSISSTNWASFSSPALLGSRHEIRRMG